MPEEQQQSQTQFIACPVCAGTGKRKAGLACNNCYGMGVGRFYQGKFFYWGPKLGRAYIELSHLRRSFQMIINLIGITIGLIGIAAIAWWFWSRQALGNQIFLIWRIQNPLILLFWFGIAAWMFTLYRLTEEEGSKQKIISLKYEEKKKQYQLPDNWDELKKVKEKYRIDVSCGFSYDAMKIIEEAYNLASRAKHQQVTIMHLFFSLFKDNQVVAVFSRLNVDGAKLIDKVKKQLIKIEPGEGKTELSSQVKQIFIEAYFYADSLGQKKVKAINLILPCMKNDKILFEILYDLEVDLDKINNVITWLRINDRLIENYRNYRKAARFKPASAMDRAYTAVATPILNHFAYDLTVAAKWSKLELCVGRDEEIEDIFHALESGKSGIILVGPGGVGKNTIIGGIAQLMVEENVPKLLRDKRLLELDVARLVSGATPAQAEERLLVALDEIVRAGNIILFIDNIENLIGITAGTEESLELSEVLVNALSRRRIFAFAAATNQNYLKYIENTALGSALTKVEIEEPSGNQAIQMVESKIGGLESQYKIYFSYNAIASAVELASKYIHDKYLPAKAIDVLESTAIKIAKEKGDRTLITERDVAETVSQLTRIPVSKVTEKESKQLLKLEERIHERMINQEEAVNMVSASLRRARAQLREGKRPIANFLFLGPTGVGKTELAKTVSEVYFGREEYMIRIDMSEYQHPDSVKKMIGDASGARGYLTDAVRKAPFSLILLDEFEKAYQDILNLFLQVMEDGRLTDGQGRTIDFTNSIIIATSNVGAVYIQDQITKGADIEQIKQALVNQHLNKVIRPELLNRFDGIIVFKPLNKANVIDITKLMLARIAKMLNTKGISMRAEEEGVYKLAEQGFDPKFGARPLRRLLQEKVENQIANRLLAGDLDRRDTVIIDANAEVLMEKGKEL